MAKKIPQRQCIGCRQVKNKNDLVRIVKNDELIEVDLSGKKNGRGAYICRSKDCLAKAYKSKGLEKSFKAAISQKVYSELEESLDEIISHEQ